MMKRQEFVLAVIVALTVPVIFGGVYLVDMYDKKGANTIISSLENETEILIFGNTNIDTDKLSVVEDKNYKEANFCEFSIKYATGTKPYRNYSLVLDHITFDEWDKLGSIKWILAQYNASKDNYITVRSGTFRDGDDASMVLMPNTSITLMDTEKYRFYYYINRELSSNDNLKLSGRIVLE